MNAGFTDQEREKFQLLLDAGFITIPSATSIPNKPISIPGGLTVSRHVRRMQGGVLTTFWPQPALPTS